MFKKFIDLIGKAWTVWGFTQSALFSTYVLPIAAAATAGVAAFVQEVPLVWLILASIWAAVGVLVFNICLLVWSFLGFPRAKLVHDKVRVHRRSPIAADGRYEIVLGFELRSLAYFPLRLKVDRLSSAIANTIPNAVPYPKTSFEIDPQTGFYFDDWPICLSTLPRDCVLKGVLQYQVSYGKGERLSTSLGRKLELTMLFDAEGNIVGHDVVEA